MRPSASLLKEPADDRDASDRDAKDRDATARERPDGLDRGAGFPEPPVEKVRGPKLVALWIALAAGSWMVAAGAGYGFYIVLRSLFF